MVTVILKLSALTSKSLELKQTLVAIAASNRNEEGCLDHRVFQDVENENSFCLVGDWKSRKYLDVHLQSDSFAVLKGTRSLLSEEPKLMIHEVSHFESMALKSKNRF